MTKKEIREIIIATTFGDATLHGRKNKYIMFGHCEKQLDYAKWKIECITKAMNISYNSCLAKSMTSPNGNRQRFFKFWSKSHHRFTAIYRRIYINGKKTITASMLNKLGNLGLAVWFCDDGNKVKLKAENKIRAFQFNLGNIKEEEVILFQDWLKIKFRINSKKYLQRGKYFIVKITKNEDKLLFVTAIKDFIPECMQYKIN